MHMHIVVAVFVNNFVLCIKNYVYGYIFTKLCIVLNLKVVVFLVVSVGRYIYCILRGRIKGFNSAIYAKKCQQVVIELWLGSYRTIE